MKTRNFAFAFACALSLAACDTDRPAPRDETITVIDDECPRADGEPCR